MESGSNWIDPSHSEAVSTIFNNTHSLPGFPFADDSRAICCSGKLSTCWGVLYLEIKYLTCVLKFQFWLKYQIKAKARNQLSIVTLLGLRVCSMHIMWHDMCFTKYT